MRNRIISGLSEGIIVVQGKEKAVRWLLQIKQWNKGEKFCRTRFIIWSLRRRPYKINPAGAKAIWSAEDIFEELPERNVQYTEPFWIIVWQTAL